MADEQGGAESGDKREEQRSVSTHYYVSTACQHERHPDCRIFCKFCGTTCLCPCHDDWH